MEASLEVKQNEPDSVGPDDDLIRFYPLRNRRLRHWLAIPTGILLLLLAPTSLLYGFFTTWKAVEHHGRALFLKTFPPFLLIAGLALLLGLAILISTSRRWNDSVGIYPSGITIQQGRKSNFIPWESVKQFDTRTKLVKFATSVMEVRSKVILETENAKRFRITDRIADMQDLVMQCRQQLLPRLYEKSLHTLREGGQLVFHPHLIVNVNSLIIKGLPHPWEGLEPVIKNRMLAIRQLYNQEIIFKRNVNQFRNTDILLALLESPPYHQAHLSPR
jgi:hypothetical protein